MKKPVFGFIAILILSHVFSAICIARTDKVNIHGFISQGYMKTTRNDFISGSKDGTFEFNEMGINFGYKPLDDLLIGVQFFARDLGSTGNDEVVVDLAFADYRLKDYLGIRAGKMKNPMGIYSETRDVDMLRTCIFLPLSVYDEFLRDSQCYLQGAGIYGYLTGSGLGTLHYQFLVGTNNISKDSGTADFIESGMVDVTSVDMSTTYTGAVSYSDPSGIILISGAYSESDLDIESTARQNETLMFLGISEGDMVYVELHGSEIFTGSFEFTFRNFVLTTEAKLTKIEGLTLFDSNKNAFFRQKRDNYGHYIMGSYRINDLLELGIYYEEYFPFENDRHGHNPLIGFKKTDHWLKKWAFSCKFDINMNWTLKLETQYADGTASLLYEPTETSDRYWYLYAAKMTYNF